MGLDELFERQLVDRKSVGYWTCKCSDVALPYEGDDIRKKKQASPMR